MSKKIKILVVRQQSEGASVFITKLKLKSITDEFGNIEEDLVYKSFEEKFDMEFNRTFCDWFQISGEINTLL